MIGFTPHRCLYPGWGRTAYFSGMSGNHQAWLARLPDRPVTRFAPSPTGELHLGHVANAVWTWGIAKATGGTVVLRIEDHDRGRSKREFEHGILSDLAWLGLEPDRMSFGSLTRDTPSPWRQSDSTMAYRSALQRLITGGQVYGCTCSRSQIARSVDMGQLPEGAEIPYPGTCRDRGLPLDAPGTGIRLVMPPGAEGFDDLRLGAQVQVPATQCGDLLLRDGTGNWTYQFAVTVDDLRHDISLVVRGEDLLDSTGRQILLGRLLGRLAPVQFLHHPLINNPEGKKLSKRDRALSLRAMREGGARPSQVLEGAARRSSFPAELQWWEKE